MSQPIHLNIPGYGPSDGSCLPCSGITGRVVSISPCSSRRDFQKISQVKLQVVSLRCASRSTSSVCHASSGSYRRNPDFSKQNKHGFSHNRNRQFEDKDGSDNLEESELFSSKNGPLSSASGTPKFQGTATPGPREKEIVELFRKVQAQLRERAAVKEQKKNEDPQGQSKQNETVDSLLKLLRKHSVQQGKRSNSTGSNSDFILDQPEPNGSFSTEKSSTFFHSNNTVKKRIHESDSPPVSRPISSFRSQSPVPQIKKQPPDEDTINSISDTNLEGDQKDTDPEPEGNHEPKLKFKIEPPEPEGDHEPNLKFKIEPELELELEPEPEPEAEAELESIFPNGDMFDEMSGDETSDTDEGNSDIDADDEQDTSDDRDLNGMKLPELRALAKSRGMKGFSKLKKRELVELLTEGSIRCHRASRKQTD